MAWASARGDPRKRPRRPSEWRYKVWGGPSLAPLPHRATPRRRLLQLGGCRFPGSGDAWLLALVAQFAGMHGGRTWVQERPQGGASFRVFLPDVPDPDAATPVVPPHSERRSR